MICNDCGREVPAGEVFCRYCGKSLQSEQRRRNSRQGQSGRVRTEQPTQSARVRTEQPSQSEQRRRTEKTRRHTTCRPGEANAPSGKAASPNEYFLDETYYGETEPFVAKAKKRAPERRSAAEVQGYSSEYPPYPPYPAYPAYPQEMPAARRKSRVPYLVVSFLTALVSVCCFLLPFRDWVTCHYALFDYQLSDSTLSFAQLARRFFDCKTIVALVTGYESDTFNELVPDAINEQYAQGRLLAIILAAAMLLALVFYVIFIFSVVFRLRGAAAATGIIASLLYGGASCGVIFAADMLNKIVMTYDDYSWNVIQFKVLEAPYIAVGLAALIFLMCIVFAVLGSGTKRR